MEGEYDHDVDDIRFEEGMGGDSPHSMMDAVTLWFEVCGEGEWHWLQCGGGCTR